MRQENNTQLGKLKATSDTQGHVRRRVLDQDRRVQKSVLVMSYLYYKMQVDNLTIHLGQLNAASSGATPPRSGSKLPV